MYLTTPQACERLGISRETLRKLIKSGEIEATRTKPGRYGHLRIKSESIDALLERNVVAPESATA